MSGLSKAATAAVEAWNQLDWNPATLAEVAGWDEKTVMARLGRNRLEFGTAGLRGCMGAGYDRMNDVTVMQTSQGLVAHLEDVLGVAEVKTMGIVVGYDGRYNSERMAHCVAAVCLAKSVKVYLHRRVVATPIVPYTVCNKRAAGGVQVTASHNPKQDNGYKVYASNGAQIIAPTDGQVAVSILENIQPWAGVKEALDPATGLLRDPSRAMDVLEEVWAQYLTEMKAQLCRHEEINKAAKTKFVYTAMHGVGYLYAAGMYERFGHDPARFFPVAEQQHPDPEFPTVPFPNPEEKGALDRARACAEAHGATIVLANDPDADRFAAAERLADGSWHVFHGDELGTLFADWQVRCLKEGGADVGKLLLINSAVSSRMLSKLAAARGCQYRDTLTGFKWMSNESIKARMDDSTLIHALAYEEAIGYQMSADVPDKDGVSAAAVFAEFCSVLETEGKTPFSHLDELRKELGYFVTNNSYFLCYDPRVMEGIFDAFRDTECGKGRGTLGEGDLAFPIASVRDVTRGLDSCTANGQSVLPIQPSQQMLTITFENGAVVTIRGSGTEPKLKWYAEISRSSVAEAREAVDKVAECIIKYVLKPEVHGLKAAGC